MEYKTKQLICRVIQLIIWIMIENENSSKCLIKMNNLVYDVDIISIIYAFICTGNLLSKYLKG